MIVFALHPEAIIKNVAIKQLIIVVKQLRIVMLNKHIYKSTVGSQPLLRLTGMGV